MQTSGRLWPRSGSSYRDLKFRRLGSYLGHNGLNIFVVEVRGQAIYRLINPDALPICYEYMNGRSWENGTKCPQLRRLVPRRGIQNMESSSMLFCEEQYVVCSMNVWGTVPTRENFDSYTYIGISHAKTPTVDTPLSFQNSHFSELLWHSCCLSLRWK